MEKNYEDNGRKHVIVNSSKNADKFENFFDEIVDVSEVLNDYVLKNKK